MPNNVDAFLRIIEGRQDIDGRFESLRRVGTTGGDGYFSLVFRARDTLTNCDVAIKVFRPDRNDPYRLACFQREAQVLQSLQGQPDILGWVAPYSEFVQELSTNAGIVLPLRLPYYAVELAETDVGFALESGRWNLEQGLQGFHVMCRAVQRIHSRGIAHRDLKPSNFLIMFDGSLKISDFGTARELGGRVPPLLAQYQFAPGDNRYTSPEMFGLLHDEDPRFAFDGDIFALGSILFELLTGTCLGVVLDSQFRNDILQVMTNVPPGQRRRIYDQFIGQIADNYPLPKLAAFGKPISSSVLDRVEELYMSMAALNYATRMKDFNRIFLAIRSCLIILRNDKEYLRWRENREKYRRDRDAKRQRAASRIQLAS